MSSNESVEIRRLILLEEREKSIKVRQGGLTCFLPRSQITYLRKHPAPAQGERECDVTIPEWLADEKGLE